MPAELMSDEVGNHPAVGEEAGTPGRGAENPRPSGRGVVKDGNYASTMPRRLAVADTVIFLDLAWWTCLWNILRRRWHYRGGQHDDGVYDHLSVGFTWYVMGYRRRMAPQVRRLIDEHAPRATVVTLRSRQRAAAWLAQVAASNSAP